jgi:hypothetical protein
MSDDRTKRPAADTTDDERDAVLAADDTGLVRGEQLITQAELEEGDAAGAGDT